MNVPEQVKRSVNVAANFMCDNAVYVLGLTGKEAKDPGYAQKRFEAFRKLNVEILSRIDSPIARAVIAFLQRHDPQTAREDPVIARHLDALIQGSNLVFQVEGRSALDDPKSDAVGRTTTLGQEAVEMQCLVTGEVEPIARLHPDIKGVRDAQTNRGFTGQLQSGRLTTPTTDERKGTEFARQPSRGFRVWRGSQLSALQPEPKP